MLRQKRKKERFRRGLIAAPFVTLLCVGILMALMVSSIEITKDLEPADAESSAVAPQDHSAELLTRGGDRITVSAAEQSVPILALSFLPPSALEHVTRMRIRNDVDNVVHIFQVAAYSYGIHSYRLYSYGL